jgi:adenylate kinase
VLDGFPRTVAQAEALDASSRARDAARPLSRAGGRRSGAGGALLKRAQIEGRSDDNETTIGNRMRVYRAQTEPLVACYRRKGLLREIDGMGTIDEVEQRIHQGLGA